MAKIYFKIGGTGKNRGHEKMGKRMAPNSRLNKKGVDEMCAYCSGWKKLLIFLSNICSFEQYIIYKIIQDFLIVTRNFQRASPR